MNETKITVTHQHIVEMMVSLEPAVLRVAELYDCRPSEARDVIRQAVNHMWPEAFSPVEVTILEGVE